MGPLSPSIPPRESPELRLRDEFRSGTLLTLLALAVVVRVALMALYFPAVMLSYDSPRFARTNMGMFGDFWMPAGYPFLLQVLRRISAELWFTIAVQHLIGIATGVILFLTLRRLGAARGWAAVPTLFVFVSGDHLYLEHILLADFLLTFLAAAGIGAAVPALTGGSKPPWLALASALFGIAMLVRTPGVVLLGVLLLCAVCSTRGSWRSRATAAATALVPGLAVVLLYIAVVWAVGGRFLGISDMRGWNLYARVAPFADCGKFQPPAELRVLCEERPPTERPGPFGYVWDLESVPRRTFPLGPKTGRQLEVFALRAIRHQPLDYLRAVGLDLVRYVDPTVTPPRPYAGQPRELISFGWRDPEVERLITRALGRVYRGTTVRLRGQEFLGRYQQVVRVGGSLLLAFLVCAAAGLVTARGALRLGIVLFGLSAVALYVLPVLTLSYDFRYGIPPSTFVVATGTIGAMASWQRLARRAGDGGSPDPR